MTMPACSPWPYCRQVLRTAQYYNKRTAALPEMTSDANAAASAAIRMILPVTWITRPWCFRWAACAPLLAAVFCARTAIAAPRRWLSGGSGDV